MREEPHKRNAQKALASEVVRDLHKEEGLQAALSITQALFSGNLSRAGRKHAQGRHHEHGKTERAGRLDAARLARRHENRRQQAGRTRWIKGNSIAVNGVKSHRSDTRMTREQAYIDNDLIIRRWARNAITASLWKDKPVKREAGSFRFLCFLHDAARAPWYTFMR